MTDPITTPAQMREADYCPFCGGMTETDFYQPYRSIGGKLGKACAIYCLDCSANMTICHEDRPGVDLEHLMSALVTEWNRRAMPEAEPEPLAVQARAEALDALLADDEMCLRLAEGYDREDAAQRGEPTPHTMGEDGYAEWAADRIACAKEGLRAIRAMMEKPE